MNMTTESIGDVAIVRVSETRLMYPLLSEFADAVTALIKARDTPAFFELRRETLPDVQRVDEAV